MNALFAGVGRPSEVARQVFGLCAGKVLVWSADSDLHADQLYARGMIIRGANVFPSQIEELVLKIEGLAPHYQLEVWREGVLDALRVHVECDASADGGASVGAGRGLTRLLGFDQLLQCVAEVREGRVGKDPEHLEMGIGVERLLLLLDDGFVFHKALDEALQERAGNGSVSC